MASDQVASIIRAFPGNSRETLTSLPLQIALHFNAHVTPFWAIIHITCFIMKYKYLPLTYQVVLTPVHLLYTIIEGVRLYLGYYGNLSEKLSALSGFCICTGILQMPICAFLFANPGIIVLPMERFILIVHFAFMLIEIVAAMAMLLQLARSQEAKFKRRALEEEENVDKDLPHEAMKTS